ncbi:MAG TPA: hypothetical protein VHE81_06665 [Lacipirellulaceae bacterium]|jgi:hypothetical protein|nr:hypothetical protein [Lacipirellulaceae bacterium]
MQKILNALPMIAAAFGFGLIFGLVFGLPPVPIALGAVGAEVGMRALT